MIARINQIWILYNTQLVNRGFSISGQRVGLIFNGTWLKVDIERDSSNFTTVFSNNRFNHEISYSKFTNNPLDIDNAKKLQGRLVLAAMLLNSGETVIVGVDNPLRVRISYTTGKNPDDIVGITYKLSCSSRYPAENFLITKDLNTIKYGFLYNWYIITDARNITNEGWHVPDQNEYEIFATYLGGLNTAGGKLKEIDFVYWDDPNTGATNEVRFNGRGAGSREDIFFGLNQLLAMWLNALYGNVATAQIYYNDAGLYIYADIEFRGHSIRLVKDSTSLSHGQTGTYTGNDGKIYRTICIGTQEWLADNLAETKYRDGSWIHGFDGGVYTPIDDATWQGLTTGALCAYNNDLSNV